jgi:BetR domain.
MQYNHYMSDIQESISRAISVLLTRMGKNQAWLARELGVSSAWVSNRMTGKTFFDTDDLAKISAVCDLPPFELFRLAEAETCAVA